MRKMLRRTPFHQAGFTLIEISIALLAGSILIAGIGYGIFQVFSMNARNTSHMTAVREVQNAGYWFTRDAGQAPRDKGSPGPWVLPMPSTGSISSSNVTVSWLDADNLAVKHSSTFTWDATSATITRKLDAETPAIIAKHISNASFSVTLDATNRYVVTIQLDATSSVPSWNGSSSTETRSYRVTPRAGQGQ
jgi:prepilin-type N-terminal cleavage/methylation domain-containing protein